MPYQEDRRRVVWKRFARCSTRKMKCSRSVSGKRQQGQPIEQEYGQETMWRHVLIRSHYKRNDISACLNFTCSFIRGVRLRVSFRLKPDCTTGTIWGELHVAERSWWCGRIEDLYPGIRLPSSIGWTRRGSDGEWVKNIDGRLVSKKTPGFLPSDILFSHSVGLKVPTTRLVRNGLAETTQDREVLLGFLRYSLADNQSVTRLSRKSNHDFPINYLN